MRKGVWWCALAGVVAASGVAALAPTAGAAITPAISLDQSAGNTAGSTSDLGVDLTFAPTVTDSPDHMTLSLPPGLLANASIDGGSCLTRTDLDDSACQVGSGVVTAYAYGTVPIPTSVTFDLVPPPAAGDLAGLAVNSSGTQVGATADIRVRPSGDLNGVGLTIEFVLPNSLDGVPISIHEISSTFNGLRYPTTCPATAQSFAVSADSYADSTVHSAGAPLSVTGCSALPYSPSFAVTATRDSDDPQVKVLTDITQSASEAPSRSIALALPAAQLSANIQGLQRLCMSLASGTCAPVGSVTAASPLYPRALTGQAYLTGSFPGLTLTLIFPPPFPLTLIGSVNLITNVTTFTGLPDIPLTSLQVALDGGPQGLFKALCHDPSGSASATLIDQNGDKTVTAPATFTIAGCTASSGGGTSPSSGGGPRLSGASATGLASGHPSLSFRVRAAKGAAKLKALTVELPRGLSVITHRAGAKLAIGGVRVRRGAVRSLSLLHGHLVIALRRAVSAVTVTLSGPALKESPALRSEARRRTLKHLALGVIAENAKGRRTTIHVTVTHLGL
ncbi:MAG TPA: hypothetical protein VHV28_12470 [Solirubrobacteraceae bacterium]|nr:hypothetical protein [Solirubrobacteraceae bacterium]